MGKAGKIVRLVRVMRVLRIFKLVRYFTALQSLMFTLNQVQGCISGDAFKLFWLRLTKNLACWCSLLGFASSLLRRWSSLQRRYTCFTNYQKKSLLIFQDIVFKKFHGLDFIYDNSGSPGWLLDISWLNLVGAHDSHYCRVRLSMILLLSLSSSLWRTRMLSFHFMEFFIFRYGDIAPASFAGKVMGGLCALCGTFILTLPLPIVVNR